MQIAKAVRDAAKNCGISCKGLTVKGLQEIHNKLKHPEYADQFDMMLEEVLVVAMKQNENFVL